MKPFLWQRPYDMLAVDTAKEAMENKATPDEMMELMKATFPKRLAMMCDGATVAEIVKEYPYITKLYIVSLV